MRTVHQLTCFGSRPGEGNAALVVLGDASSAAERQAFAREQNRSACVFVDAGNAAGADGRGDADAQYVLDYFYPHMRSPLCLHATLAAARVLLRERGGPLAVRTAMQGQPLHLSERAAGVFVRLQRQPVPVVAIGPELPAALLGQEGSRAAPVAAPVAAPGAGPGAEPGAAWHLASPPAIASVGSPKLLLELASVEALRALRPDLARIAAWGKQHGVSGCYAYARLADGSFEGRNFNHLDPALEDSATGVAAGAITVHLGRAITLHQGGHIGQPCLLRTELDGEHILIGGAAEFLPVY